MYKREFKSNGYSRKMRIDCDDLDMLGEEIMTTIGKKIGVIRE